MTSQKNKMVRSCWFMFLRTDFENTENIFLVFFENSSCYLNLVFFILLIFFRTKNGKGHVCLLFLKAVLYFKK